MTLPLGLRGLASYRHWCAWKLEHAEGEAKPRKVPVSAHNGFKFNHTDPNNLVDYETASQAVDMYGLSGVAYVFMESDPYFFLDIDSCAENGHWNATAQQMLAMFKGAAVELSQSGNGLHVIGQYGSIPNHAKKNKALGLELYHDKRFIALTLNGVVGSVDVDCTTALHALCASHFPPSDIVTGDWTDGPDPTWIGPTDDDELLTRAFRSVSIEQAIGAKASIKDLYERNVDTLSRCYPDTFGNGRPYDGSAVDQALASHLAFWTGKDCERIERIMRASKLYRAKWDQHSSYLRMTIQRACAATDNVYQSKQNEEPVTPPTSDDINPKTRTGFQFMPVSEQLVQFHNCVYVCHHDKIMIPNGRMLKRTQFNAMYGGWTFATDSTGEKTSDDAWKCFTESQAVNFPKVFDESFRPDLEPGSIFYEDGDKVVNSYRPAKVPCKEGDVTRFINHLRLLIPDENDREILLSYMAAIVQYPGVKFQWCPLLIGAPGNGKSLLTTVIQEAVGAKYCHVVNKVESIANDFNAWLANKIFIGFEDVYSETMRRTVYELLKPMITNPRQPITPKGVDSRMSRVVANMIMNSNHDDALPKDINDRRLCIFHCAQKTYNDIIRDGMDGQYFPDLYDWLRGDGYAAITHHLKHYQIPDQYNPATRCHRAPETSTTDFAVAQSRGRVEQEIIEAIESGQPGFSGGWVSATALSKLMDRLHVRINRSKYRDIMGTLGYIPHPVLKNGRTTSATATDMARTQLFVDGDDKLLLCLPDSKSVVSSYDRSQRQSGYDVATAVANNIAIDTM